MYRDDIESWITQTHNPLDATFAIFPSHSAKPVVLNEIMSPTSPIPSDVHIVDDVDVTPTKASPPKRRRLDITGQSLDLRQRTLTESPPALQSTSSITPSTRTTTTSAHRSRTSRSPVKSVSDLRLSEKPVEASELDSFDQLPPDVVTLFCDIKRVCGAGHDLVPQSIKQRFLSSLTPRDMGYSDASFYEAQEWAASRALEMWDETRELEVFTEVVSNTKECKRENFSEPAWNARVHEPLLNFVLKCFRGQVRHYDVTRAAIDKPYVPSLEAGADMQSKMVDFCLTLAGDNTMRAAKRRNKINNSISINHTSYEPVRDRPIAVNIETKTPGSSSKEAEAQLSVWTLAHLKRLRSLACTSTSTLAIDITIPVIYVCGGDWVLYFVRDQVDKMELIEACSIGDTRTLVGCYKVAAFLRHLGIWMRTVYQGWIMENALVLETRSDSNRGETNL